MTISEAYIKYLDLVNRNATNNNINVDKPRFIILFNDIQNRYLEWVLDKRNSDDIRYIQLMLVNNHALIENDNKDVYTSFSIPNNYFNFSNLRVNSKRGNCKNRKMLAFEIKSENREELMNDEFNKPSFEYSETFYYFSNDSILIYKDDFEIQDAILSYYRYPNKVDIDGYLHLDGSVSTSIDPEWDDKVTMRILIAMSREFAAINSDAGQYQLDKDRLFTSKI